MFEAFFPKITLPSDETDIRKGDGFGIRCGGIVATIDFFQGGEATKGLIAWLRSIGASQIDLAVATHAHGDHFGGYYEAVEAGIRIKEFRCYHPDSIRGGNDESRKDSDNLLKLIRWLQENGYECLTVSEMFQRFSGGEITGKTAVITFDDGYPDVYTYAFPVLSVYGFPATTYLVASKIDSPKNLTAEMIRDLHDAGWEIGSHSMTHSDLLNHEDLDSEICGSRNLIAAMTGIPLSDVVSFAYPYGNADETVITKVWKCGYLSGAGLGQIPVSASQNPCYFSRHPVTSDMTLEDFTALFLPGDEK